MKRVIWKYKAQSWPGTFARELPAGAKILPLVALQYGAPCFWVEIDLEAKRIQREFRVVGMGEEFDTGSRLQVDFSTGRRWHSPEWDHVGSWLDGSYVWHLYAKSEEAK